jgi:hypothetical protein
MICNNVQVICLFSKNKGFCDGLSNVKCPKVQS